jgi:hypothetical protein
MRSLATRQANLALSRHVRRRCDILRAAGYDLIMLETSGIGQSDTEITEHSRCLALCDDARVRRRDAAREDRHARLRRRRRRSTSSTSGARWMRCATCASSYKRNRGSSIQPDDALPVFGTIASQFNDPGTNRLYQAILMATIVEKTGADFVSGGSAGRGVGEGLRDPAAADALSLGDLRTVVAPTTSGWRSRRRRRQALPHAAARLEELAGDVDPAMRKVFEDKLQDEARAQARRRCTCKAARGVARQKSERTRGRVRVPGARKEIRVTNYHESSEPYQAPEDRAAQATALGRYARAG